MPDTLSFAWSVLLESLPSVFIDGFVIFISSIPICYSLSQVFQFPISICILFYLSSWYWVIYIYTAFLLSLRLFLPVQHCVSFQCPVEFTRLFLFSSRSFIFSLFQLLIWHLISLNTFDFMCLLRMILWSSYLTWVLRYSVVFPHCSYNCYACSFEHWF